MINLKKSFLFPFILFISFTLLSPIFLKPSVSAASPIPFVILTKYKGNINIGDTLQIVAITSNGKLPTWKSSHSSIASVNTYGKVLGKKSGTAIITAKIKGGEASCKVTVNKTKVTISKITSPMYRGDTTTLKATTSSNSIVKWKSNKSSVARVNQDGEVTAVKNGSAIITATADGVSASCTVTVKKPKITLNHTELHLKAGDTKQIKAKVSSNNPPAWSTSNSRIATVDDDGEISVFEKGRVYIYASEDGTKVRCTVYVTE